MANPTKRKIPRRTFGKTPIRPGGRAYQTKRGFPKFVTVTLQLRHSFNGKFYGPGTVKLPHHKAEMFLNTEHEAAQKELSLQQQQAYIISMGGGAPAKRQVPWAQFDTILGRDS